MHMYVMYVLAAPRPIVRTYIHAPIHVPYVHWHVIRALGPNSTHTTQSTSLVCVFSPKESGPEGPTQKRSVRGRSTFWPRPEGPGPEPTHVTNGRSPLVTCVRTYRAPFGALYVLHTCVCTSRTHVPAPLKGGRYVLISRRGPPSPQEGGSPPTYVLTYVLHTYFPPSGEVRATHVRKYVGPSAPPPSRGGGRRPLHIYCPFGAVYVYHGILGPLAPRYRVNAPSGLVRAFGPRRGPGSA